jgi:hypothetical protein
MVDFLEPQVEEWITDKLLSDPDRVGVDVNVSNVRYVTNAIFHAWFHETLWTYS